MDQLSRIFHWEVFQYDKFSNVPNLQLDKSMPEKNIPNYVLHNWLYRTILSKTLLAVKVPFIQAKSIMLHWKAW